MGLIWVEGFESNQYASKVNANGTTVVDGGGPTSTTPRTDSRKLASGNYKLLFGAGDQDDLIILGSGYQLFPSVGEKIIARFLGDARATTHLTVVIVPASTAGNPATIKVYRGTTAGTLLGTSSSFLQPPPGTWVHIEIKARLHDSTGSVVVRLDEQTILNLSGVDTKNGGTGSVFDGVDVVPGDDAASPGSYACAADDTYVANEQGSVNTDFQGAKRVETKQANGNGTTSNGVGSDGNSADNYDMINDVVTVNTGDYIDLATTGDRDTYAFDNSLQPTGNAVAGVFVWAYAQKTDAGSRTVVPVARLSGTESDGDALALLNGTYKFVGDVFETKPGGGAWTVADFNSAEFGSKAGA